MISNINFCGTYRIDLAQNQGKEDAVFDTEDKFCRLNDFRSYITFPEKHNESMKAIFVVDDDNDSKIESYLLSKGVKFSRAGLAELFSNEAIKQRMVLPEGFGREKFSLVEIKTDKFNQMYKYKGFAYVGDKGNLEFPERYEEFGQYLKSGQKIDAPQVHISDMGSYPEISFHDGRHRYAYLRDLGMEKIPIVLDRESQKCAVKYGLV